MKNIPKKQFAGWMLMLLLCISTSAFAQSPKKVTGRVMDAQGELLIGVNVTEAADPSNGVVTDINGTYTITLKGNKPSLKFSYIGFKDKVVAVGSKGVLDVALEEDVAALDEVVVVGFGTQKKASVVGSITNIEPAKLAAAPSRSLSNNLAGMVPGVRFSVAVTLGSITPTSGFVVSVALLAIPIRWYWWTASSVRSTTSTLKKSPPSPC